MFYYFWFYKTKDIKICTTIDLFINKICFQFIIGMQMVLMVIVGATPDMDIKSEQQLKTIVTDVCFSIIYICLKHFRAEFCCQYTFKALVGFSFFVVINNLV